MYKFAKWILVIIAVTVVCTATAEAATWKFKSNSGYTTAAWGMFNGNGWLTVEPTINCDPQGALIDNEYILGDRQYEGEIPTGKGYNDFQIYFKWDYPCGNDGTHKMYVCEEVEALPLPEWIDDNIPPGQPEELPSFGDPNGLVPQVYVAVNLRLWRENRQPVQSEYHIENGECPELPGYRFGTTPFAYQPGEICHPLVTENPLTGTLYPHAEVTVIGEQPIRPPTLSQWGLIIMALLLVTVGAIMIRKRRQVIT